MSGIRTFIAIETPIALKDTISKTQRELMKIRGANVAWVRPEGIHLTLKFLGDVDPQNIPHLVSKVKDSCVERQPFSIHTTSTGGFPRLAHPRVLWLGVSPTKELLSLQAAIDMALTDLGFKPEDKAFHPHLTIGRVKSLSRDCALPQIFQSLEFAQVEWVVSEVRIMSSVLKPTGAEYSVLDSINLG